MLPIMEFRPITNTRSGVRRVETYKRSEPKIGRNELCPCGSGVKFKNAV